MRGSYFYLRPSLSHLRRRIRPPTSTLS